MINFQPQQYIVPQMYQRPLPFYGRGAMMAPYSAVRTLDPAPIIFEIQRESYLLNQKMNRILDSVRDAQCKGCLNCASFDPPQAVGGTGRATAPSGTADQQQAASSSGPRAQQDAATVSHDGNGNGMKKNKNKKKKKKKNDEVNETDDTEEDVGLEIVSSEVQTDEDEGHDQSRPQNNNQNKQTPPT
jgi:hypothetical protein